MAGSERGIYAHTLAVAHKLGRLQEYTKSYQVPLANMVAPTIPNSAGNGAKNRTARESLQTMEIERIYLFMKWSSLSTQKRPHAMVARGMHPLAAQGTQGIQASWRNENQD